MPTRKIATKTRGRPFERGNRGKPKGARHRITLLAETLMADDAEAVVAKVVEAAKGGDMTAARLILDRVVPPRRGRPVAFSLPKVNSPKGVTDALAAVVAAMARGEITAEEASAVCAILEIQRRSLETLELEVRMSKIEAQINHAQGN